MRYERSIADVLASEQRYAEAVNRVRLVLGAELPAGTVPDYATGWAHAMTAVGRALGDVR
jgi:hypothetical protein